MSLKHLKIDSDVETPDTDTLPSAGGFTVDTGLHEMIIDVAYMDTSPTTEAEALKFHLKPADGSPKEVREAFWVRSGTKKGGNTYYVNPKGKKISLPGFVDASQLAAIACGKPLADLVEEEKILKLWNSANQAEENTKVRWLPELVGKPVLACILKIRDNKMQKVGNDYVKTAAERFSNEVDKVLYPNGLSVTEKNAGATEASFKDRWAARYPEGEIIDQYEDVPDSQPDTPATEDDGATAESITNLFGTDS